MAAAKCAHSDEMKYLYALSLKPLAWRNYICVAIKIIIKRTYRYVLWLQKYIITKMTLSLYIVHKYFKWRGRLIHLKA